MTTKNESSQLPRLRTRLLVFGLLSSLWVAAIAGRLIFLQVVSRAELQERAGRQQRDTIEVHANRGTIYDRHGNELAVSVDVDSIYADPRAFDGDGVSEAARLLGGCLGQDPSGLVAKLSSSRSFVWLERKASRQAASCVRSLEVAGIGFLPESRRFYPKRNIAAHVLGYVGIDNKGLGGIELSMETEIQGESGEQLIWTDARRRRMMSRIENRPRPGRSVYLTLDENLQHMVEVELDRAVSESNAKGGTAILMHSASGEIVAMSSRPTFNPNAFEESPESFWRNRIVTDAYEPGSTFKIVTAAAALEEEVVTETERIDCGGGGILVGSREIRDSRNFDFLPFSDVIAQSSNVGMIRIGQRLGRRRFENYIRRFGFGERTGVELQAESRGILRAEATWGPVSLASMSFGQEIAVTPLQMILAANVIASDGYLLRPRLILGVGENDHTVPSRLVPVPVRRVVSRETAARMRSLLEGVVQFGTGRRARVDGHRIAGKTGTAQKAIAGGYSKTDFVASFVGFAPAHQPELTALVILDSPSGDHSGGRAAAVFSKIMARALRYTGVEREDQTRVRVVRSWPASGSAISESASAFDPDRYLPGDAPGTMPDLAGLSARDAFFRLSQLGLEPELVGSGWVVSQQPMAGEPLLSVEPRLTLGPRDGVPDPDTGRENRRGSNVTGDTT